MVTTSSRRARKERITVREGGKEGGGGEGGREGGREANYDLQIKWCT